MNDHDRSQVIAALKRLNSDIVDLEALINSTSVTIQRRTLLESRLNRLRTNVGDLEKIVLGNPNADSVSKLTLREFVEMLKGDPRIRYIPFFHKGLTTYIRDTPLRGLDQYQTIGDVLIEDILKCSIWDLRKIRQLGLGGIRALEEVLADHGLRLNQAQGVLLLPPFIPECKPS